MMSNAIVGLMGGMPEEINALVPLIEQPSIQERAGRQFIRGTLCGTPVVAVFSRWGKVAAASTATELIVSQGVSRLIFSGVAGSLREQIGMGDVVIATQLVQHDFDASPFLPPRVIPFLEREFIPADQGLSSQLANAAECFVEQRAKEVWSSLGGTFPPKLAVHRGIVATGDQFISHSSLRNTVRQRVPDALCVEMEGAAVAQVCYEHGVPFAVVRTISDAADEAAEHNFLSFIAGLASAYGAGIITTWLRQQTHSATPDQHAML